MTGEEASARIAALRINLISTDDAARWAAAADLSDLVVEFPEELWPLVLEAGSSDDDDLRMAVATNLLEHLFQHHFKLIYPRVEGLIGASNVRFADCFIKSWQMGQSEDADNAPKWNDLKAKARGLKIQNAD